MIKRLKNSFNNDIIKVFLACGFLVVVTLAIGFKSSAFTGFPKGYDAFGHLSLAKIISQNFPHVFWNPYWDGGVVLFPRNYPPLYHFLLSWLSWGFSIDITRLTLILLAVETCLSAIFIFFTVWFLTKKVLGGMFSGLFFLSSSAVWSYVIQSGLYARFFGMMTVCLALLAMAIYLTTKGKKKQWAYWLTVFSFVLAFLSHFLAVVLTGFAFLTLIFFLEKSWEERIRQTLKLFLPILGLTAFYYLPVLVLRPGKLDLVGGFQGKHYEPWQFLSFFKQGYPGLPFLSLPLGGWFLVLLWLCKDKAGLKKKLVYNLFLGFGLLALLCLLYILGAYKKFFYGIYPSQFLLPAVIFLSLFLGLGLYFLEALKIIKTRLFLILLIGLLAVGLGQASKLKMLAIDQSRIYPRLKFKGQDENRVYRFGHNDEVLGGAFNFYSSGLQTRGYSSVGIIHYGFHWWFEQAVFNTFDNLEETKFLLDWFGVKNFYLYSKHLQEKGKVSSLKQKFFNAQDFAEVSNYELEYKKARPIILATNAPVILVKGKDEEYRQVLHELAKRGLDSRFLIPIRLRQAQPSDFSARVIEVPEVEEMTGEALKDQIPKFVNSQKREIEVKQGFTGALLKESYYSNWQAYLLTAKEKKQKLKIYFAGPGMMYASLPKDYDLPAKIIFEYRLGWPEKAGLGISLGTVIMIIKKRMNK